MVDGNHYFPADSLERRYLRESDTTSICPWKGTASYYDVLVADEVNSDAAWFYPEPKEAAEQIRGHVAFWRGVEVAVVCCRTRSSSSLPGMTRRSSISSQPCAS